MNEHAKKVWRAWVDGKTVQSRTAASLEDWKDDNPNGSSIDPGLFPALWRVKPKRKPIRIDFKVAIMRDSDNPHRFWLLAPKTEDFEYVESLETFVEWGTDVLSTDTVVEVEE